MSHPTTEHNFLQQNQTLCYGWKGHQHHPPPPLLPSPKHFFFCFIFCRFPPPLSRARARARTRIRWFRWFFLLFLVETRLVEIRFSTVQCVNCMCMCVTAIYIYFHFWVSTLYAYILSRNVKYTSEAKKKKYWNEFDRSSGWALKTTEGGIVWQQPTSKSERRKKCPRNIAPLDEASEWARARAKKENIRFLWLHLGLYLHHKIWVNYDFKL